MMLADLVYDVPASVILESAQRAVSGWDLITSMIKSWVFGTIIAIVSLAPHKDYYFGETCKLPGN